MKFSHIFTSLQRFFWIFFLGFFVFSIFSSSAFADGRLPSHWGKNLEEVTALQKISDDGTATEMITSLVQDTLVPIAKYVFIGVALIFMALYVYYMSIGMGEEDQLSEQRKNIIFAILGFTVLGLSAKIVEVFNPTRENNEAVIDVDATKEVIHQVITYLELGLGVIAIAVVFYGGMQMITSDGDDEKISKGKNVLKFGFIGIILVMLADPLVTTIFYPNDGNAGIGDSEASNFISEGIGVLKFLLQFFAIALFVSFVVSGFLFMTAGDNEERSEKAKNTLLWSAIGALLVLFSYSILLFFNGQLW